MRSFSHARPCDSFPLAWPKIPLQDLKGAQGSVCSGRLCTLRVTCPLRSNVEEIEHKNVKFQVWDLGGQVRVPTPGSSLAGWAACDPPGYPQENLRPSWKTYYADTNVRPPLRVRMFSPPAWSETRARWQAVIMVIDSSGAHRLLLFSNPGWLSLTAAVHCTRLTDRDKLSVVKSELYTVLSHEVCH